MGGIAHCAKKPGFSCERETLWRASTVHVRNTTHEPPRAVILAGGEGTRLRPLTRLICGDARPKQFCPLFAGETLLARTRSRLQRAVAPEHTFFAVSRAHRRFYSKELADADPGRILVQPSNKGTAAAIAYGSLRVLREGEDATVAFIPADHYYDDDAPFIAALADAFETADECPSSLVLLGAEPECAETEYGWIEPAPSEGDSKPVSRFWEKPSAAHAQDLFRRGCLWNTFVMVGRAKMFCDVLRSTAPTMMLAFERALADRDLLDPSEARRLYREIPAIDFSHQVLAVCTERLLVRKLSNTGWSDLGKPERVMETLARAGIRPQWKPVPLRSHKAIA